MNHKTNMQRKYRLIRINKKIIISWIFVILWSFLIFFMSDMDTNESNSKSREAINEIIEKSVNTTNRLGITDKHPTENKMKSVIKKLNYPLRKVAHTSEYLILTLVLIIALHNSGITDKKKFLIALLICFIYACTDEYHQNFVKGRNGQFVDTLIDTAGGVIACLLVLVKNTIVKKIESAKIR